MSYTTSEVQMIRILIADPDSATRKIIAISLLIATFVSPSRASWQVDGIPAADTTGHELNSAVLGDGAGGVFVESRGLVHLRDVPGDAVHAPALGLRELLDDDDDALAVDRNQGFGAFHLPDD